jgi:PAS domain S-box-containing protein
MAFPTSKVMEIGNTTSANRVDQLLPSLVGQLNPPPHIRLLVSLICVAIITPVLWAVVPHGRLIAWSIAMTGVQFLRYTLGFVFGTISPNGRSVAFRGRATTLSVASAGLMWGLTGVLLFPYASIPHQFLLVLFLAGVACVALVVYSPLPTCSIVAILLALLPLAWTYLSQGTKSSLTIGTGLVLFCLGLVVASLHLHRILRDSLELGFEKDELLVSLSWEKSKLEEFNGQLEAEILEHRLVTQSLRRSEERYRAVVESQTELVCRVLPDCRLSFVNGTCCTYFGRESSELIGHSLFEFIPAEDARAMRPYFLSTAGHNLSANHTHRVIKPDGEIGWLQWAFQVVLDKRNEVTEFQGVGRDITAQKRAEDALEESERRFRTLVETATDVIWTLNLDLEFTYVSPSVTQLLGYSVDEIIDIHPLDTVTPSSRQALMEALKEEISAERDRPRGKLASRAEEIQQYRKDGSLVNIEITTSFIRDAADEPIGILGISRDISRRKDTEDALKKSHADLEQRVEERTAELRISNENLQREIEERVQAEQALSESEQRFRTIFEKATDCIFIKDTDQRYTHLNPAMQAVFEVAGSEAVNLTDENLYGSDQANRLGKEDRRVLAGQVIESDHTLTLNNRELTFNCVKIPMTNSSGEVIGLCVIAREVTERYRKPMKQSVKDLGFHSQAMTDTLRHVRLAAKSNSLVLLLGESGSGKDYLANYLHTNSYRSEGPFFAINCAALPPELAESELFGHEAGSFTGARVRKRGMLELAEGGTLMLNEIGELSPPLQAKLLTFLDTHSFTRVGGEKSVEVDARLLAATNRDLAGDVNSGRFRADLFHRLNVFSIEIPPLRERLEDLPVLVESILSSLCSKRGNISVPLMDSRCMAILSAYRWPGNVRELKNVLERALILSEGGKIGPDSIRLWESRKDSMEHGEWAFAVEFPTSPQSLNDVMKEVKMQLLKEALRRSSGVKKRAAGLLNISVDALKHHTKSLGL